MVLHIYTKVTHRTLFHKTALEDFFWLLENQHIEHLVNINDNNCEHLYWEESLRLLEHNNTVKWILTLSLWKGFKKFPPISPSSLGVPGWLLRLILLGEFCKQDWEKKSLLKVFISLLHCSASNTELQWQWRQQGQYCPLRTKQIGCSLASSSSSPSHTVPEQVLMLLQMKFWGQVKPQIIYDNYFLTPRINV